MLEKLKNKLSQFSWLGILNSPFKPFKLKFYLGKTRYGTPYFYPRKWVKQTKEEIHEKALKDFNAEKRPFYLENKTLEELIQRQSQLRKTVNIKWGIRVIPHGWKTKWNEFRHEWNPGIVCQVFKWQFCICIIPPNRRDDSYWEAWLYYRYRTNKHDSQLDRLKSVFKQYSCTWISYTNNKEGIKENHYYDILKKKYLKEIKKYVDLG